MLTPGFGLQSIQADQGGIGLQVGVFCLGIVFGGLVTSALLRWRARCRPTSGDPTPSLRQRLESLERARDAAEQANLELRRALDELELAAGTDRLTGAWNRRRLEEGATAMIAYAARHHDPLSLLIFDLDNFKRVNDTLGHPAGDKVLVAVAETVRGHLRASDFLVRWGGEEFVVLLPGTDLAGASLLAEKIREGVSGTAIPEVGTVTISVGAAQHAPRERLGSWIRRADDALYQAKREGRNRVVSSGAHESAEPETEGVLALAWDPDFESGNTVIDGQHRRLFDLANFLIATLADQGDGPELTMRLQVLLAHVAQHFHDEEALLARTGYPRLREHAAKHALLLRKAWAFQNDAESSRLDRAQFLGFVAFELVKDHILREDQDHFPFLGGDQS